VGENFFYSIPTVTAPGVQRQTTPYIHGTAYITPYA